MDHPSFFPSFWSTHDDVGSPPDGEPSSPSVSGDSAQSGSASGGIASEPPDELSSSPTPYIPQNNKPAPSNTAYTHKTYDHTSDNKPQSITK